MKTQTHIMDVLFVLALFCVFVASSLSTIYIGSQVYSNISSELETNFTTNTAMNYIIEKTRQNNTQDSIQIGTIEDHDALEIYSEYDDVLYVTYIYEDENTLKELFVRADAQPSLSSGDSIIEVSSFEALQVNEHLIEIILTFEDNTTQSTYINIL